MLSICITVKNRSRVKVEGRELLLFPNCVKSIVNSVDSELDCELIVSDWESEDWPLSEWLEDAARPIPALIIKVRGLFSRGKGRNLAAHKAKGDKILFLDADMLLCPRVIRNGIKYLAQGKGYFPVSLSYYGPEHRLAWWRHTGYGNCMILKSTYTKSDGWPEHNSWGLEDDHFFSKVSSLVEVVREEVSGFYHQWHPHDPSRIEKDIRGWEQKRENKLALEKTLNSIRELEGVISQGKNFILVNEDMWELTNVVGLMVKRRALPFLENNGQYWGLPADDQEAIQELNRLRTAGADYIIFAWPSLWMLDFYSEFNRHLRSKFRCIFRSETVVVFDMAG